jgi:hypothetical protein
LSERRTASLLLELELADGFDQEDLERVVAEVNVAYRTAADGAAEDTQTMAQAVNVRTTADATLAEASKDTDVSASVLRFLMVDNRARAMEAMDAGDEVGAAAFFESNRDLYMNAPASMQAAPEVVQELEATETDKEAYEQKDEAARKQAQYSIYSARKR